jgi:hypothetical protein
MGFIPMARKFLPCLARIGVSFVLDACIRIKKFMPWPIISNNIQVFCRSGARRGLHKASFLKDMGQDKATSSHQRKVNDFMRHFFMEGT